MTSKKFFLLIAIALFAQVSLFSQTDWGWDWKDSSKIANKDLPQFNEFLNNQYPYPAKPRNQWELGFAAGPSFIIGDVASKIGYGGGVSLRKALGHVFSVRGSLSGLWNSGSPSVYGTSVGEVAYKNQSYMLGVDMIASLNSSSYYRGNPKTNIYVLAGYSLIGTRVQFKTPGGAQPDGYSIFYGQRPGMINTQEGLITTAFGNTVNRRKSYSILSGLNIGAGIAFKINDKMNVGLEQKFIFTAAGYDYLDAYKAGNNNDFYSLTTVRLNVNIGSSDKKVQPLYWINPNNFVYGEMNSPKHMKVPKVMLPDGDKDGVTDQFDMEPNTPKGAPVDTHGVSKDTDGDGVPDYRDKELLTQQKCFPVNNDGIGNCPEPACCKEIKDMMATYKPSDAEKVNCAIGSLPSVQFKGITKLSKEALAVLSAAAAQLKANPTCNVKVIGYGATSKSAQQQSWERVNAVIKYLVEKQGIAEGRLLFVYAQDGDANTVDLQGTTEQGPNTVPAPHPNLKSRN